MHRLRGLVGVVAAGAVLLLASGASQARSERAGWVVRDLGTLGGPYSKALAINNKGQIVGLSTIDPNQWRRSKLTWRPFLWQGGRMTELPTPPDFNHRYLYPDQLRLSINDRGQVIAQGFGTAEPGLLWENGKLIELPPLAGFQRSSPTAANDHGQVVGWSTSAGHTVRAFLRDNGRMTDLGTLGGKWSEASGINNLGQVIGQIDPNGSTHAFLWQNGRMTDLGRGDAVAINDHGQIVLSQLGYENGEAVDKGDWLWENGKKTKLGELKSAVAINTRGQVIGQSAQPGAPAGHTVLWHRGKTTALGITSPAAINEHGQIIGNSYWRSVAPSGNANPRGFVWQNGTMTRLGGLGASKPSLITSADAINDRGQIVGWSNTGAPAPKSPYGIGLDPPFHAVLWTPRP